MKIKFAPSIYYVLAFLISLMFGLWIFAPKETNKTDYTDKVTISGQYPDTCFCLNDANVHIDYSLDGIIWYDIKNTKNKPLNLFIRIYKIPKNKTDARAIKRQ
jgi:hypothetical protein